MAWSSATPTLKPNNSLIYKRIYAILENMY
jgi:hypothetical protein